MSADFTYADLKRCVAKLKEEGVPPIVVGRREFYRIEVPEWLVAKCRYWARVHSIGRPCKRKRKVRR